MGDLVSIILPIYKVEPYLRCCLDSALAQTYPNIEVIAVDDGSPDRCPAICDGYAAADPRVRVIHQKNAGVSMARNVALDVARGDWIMFLDGDDWYEPSIVATCIREALESGADQVFFDVDRTDGEGAVSPRCFALEAGTYPAREVLKALFRQNHNWVWRCLYARRLFDDVRFPPGEPYQDIAVMHLLVEQARRVRVVHDIGVHYRIRPDSVVMSDRDAGTYYPYKDQKARYRHYASDPELADAVLPALSTAGLDRCKYLAFHNRDDELLRTRAELVSLGAIGVEPTRNQRIAWTLLMRSVPLFKLACKRKCQRQGWI